MAAISKVAQEFNCPFENRQLTKVFIHKQTMETDVYDEYILGDKFQTILLDKGLGKMLRIPPYNKYLGGEFKRRWYRKPSVSLFENIIEEIDILLNRQLEVKHDRQCPSNKNKYSDMKLFMDNLL